VLRQHAVDVPRTPGRWSAEAIWPLPAARAPPAVMTAIPAVVLGGRLDPRPQGGDQVAVRLNDGFWV